VASVFGQSGLSVHCQLRITFSVLSKYLSKIINKRSHILELLTEKRLEFFTLDTIKTALSMTS